MRPGVVLREAWSGVWARPGRTLLTILGTVAGVATLVATLGMASTARAQVSDRFDVLAATEVVLELAPGTGPDDIPADLTGRLGRLPGMRAAGVLWPVDIAGATMRPTWSGPGHTADVQPPVFAASAGALEVIEPEITSGVTYGPIHDERADRVAIISRSVATRLHLTAAPGHPPAIFIGDVALNVIGIYDDVSRHPEVLSGILVPAATATLLFGPLDAGGRQVIIETGAGASGVVAEQAPLAIRPDAPETFNARPTPDPRNLRNQVDDDITGLLLALAGLSLLIGMFSVANTTLIGVLERVPEIGLRRSVGATRTEIALQFLIESGLSGTVGGAIGSSLAVIAVVVASATQSWTPTMNPAVALCAPLLGTVTGLLAGLLPARRAARVAPAEALRRGA